jgi:hypothetical protein
MVISKSFSTQINLNERWCWLLCMGLDAQCSKETEATQRVHRREDPCLNCQSVVPTITGMRVLWKTTHTKYILKLIVGYCPRTCTCTCSSFLPNLAMWWDWTNFNSESVTLLLDWIYNVYSYPAVLCDGQPTEFQRQHSQASARTQHLKTRRPLPELPIIEPELYPMEQLR